MPFQLDLAHGGETEMLRPRCIPTMWGEHEVYRNTFALQLDLANRPRTIWERGECIHRGMSDTSGFESFRCYRTNSVDFARIRRNNADRSFIGRRPDEDAADPENR